MQRRYAPDIHELLKQDMFDSSKQCTSHFEKNRPCPHELFGISDQYVILDSFSKVPNSAIERGEFRWNFMVQGVTSSEYIGINNVIENLIEMRIGKFTFPILEEVPYNLSERQDKIVLVQNNTSATGNTSTLVPHGVNAGQYSVSNLVGGNSSLTPWVFNPYSQLPYNGGFTIQILEAGLQAFSNRNGSRHHFNFYTKLADNPNMLIAELLNNTDWERFIFTEPIKDMHGITLVFRNPDIPIKFIPDCYYNIRCIHDTEFFLTFTVKNNLLNQGDRIFITGFASGNTSLDSYINRVEGHLAAGDPSNTPLSPGVPIHSDTFWTDPAISIINLQDIIPKLPQFVNIFVAKRRMRIPIRFRSVRPKLTNYMTIPG
jgi:hypothetical protein